MAGTEHTGTISLPFTGDDYTAACSCGWSGPVRTSEAAATNDLDGHYKESTSGK